MPRFQLISKGTHSEGDKTYKHGDVFKSPHDLDKMFANKFRRVGELAAPDLSIVDPDLAGQKRAAAAAHVQAQIDNEDEGGVATKTIKIAKKTAADARGIKVTKKFNLADGFEVFKRDEAYHVYHGDSTDPINPKGLKKTQVEQAVTDYLEE